MQTIKKELFKIGKVEINTILITAFLSLPVLANLIWQNNIFVFLGSLIIAVFFMWQTPLAGILGVLLTTMFFGEHFSLLPLKIEDEIYKIYLLDFGLFFAFVCWFLKTRVKKPKIKKFLNENLWLLVYFAFIILNLIRGLVLTYDKELVIGTFKNYSYVLVYWLIILMVNKKEQVLKFIKVLFWGGVGLIFFVLYGWLSGRGLWSEITPGQRYLSGLHSYYLTFLIIILLVLIIYKQFIFSKIKVASLFLISLLGMIGGMFRHLWLGVSCAILNIFVWSEFKQKKSLVKMGLIMICIFVIVILSILWVNGILGNYSDNFLENKFFNEIQGRASSLLYTGSTAESATGWRLATWQIALDKFSESPLVGIGFGQKFYFEYRGWLDLIDIRNIHNDFASLLVQLGILGFIPFLMFNFYRVRDLIKLLKKKDEFYKSLGLMLSGFYIVSIFGIFFAIYLMFNGTSIFYWVIVGLISVIMKSEK